MKTTSFDEFKELEGAACSCRCKEIVADPLTPVSAFLKIAEHADYAFLLRASRRRARQAVFVPRQRSVPDSAVADGRTTPIAAALTERRPFSSRRCGHGRFQAPFSRICRATGGGRHSATRRRV